MPNQTAINPDPLCIPGVPGLCPCSRPISSARRYAGATLCGACEATRQTVEEIELGKDLSFLRVLRLHAEEIAKAKTIAADNQPAAITQK